MWMEHHCVDIYIHMKQDVLFQTWINYILICQKHIFKVSKYKEAVQSARRKINVLLDPDDQADCADDAALTNPTDYTDPTNGDLAGHIW